MMAYRSFFLVGVLGCSSSSSPATDGPAGDAGPIVLTGTPIVATAKLGTGETLLGTTADMIFDQINGDAIFAPRKDASGNYVQTRVDQVMTAGSRPRQRRSSPRTSPAGA